ncbi:MAG TPA: hypothetical protein VHO50_02850 [Bacteroidales bacterium]|nr:hypothetical protein [Bacteroidales bacterium]
MNREELLSYYTKSAESFAGEMSREDRILLILSVSRLVCFVGGVILIVFMFLRNEPAMGLLTAFIIVFLFLFLLKLYSSHSDKRDFLSNLKSININEVAALSGDLSAFDKGEKYIDHSHHFSYDLDLYGDGSLFRYLNRTVTGFGRNILAGWLSDPWPLSDELAKRQEIIKELSAKISWRHEFMAEGLKVPLEKESINRLASWMEEPALAQSRLRKFLMFFLPVIALTTMVLVIAGLLHYSVLVSIIILNLVYVSTGLKHTNDVQQSVTGSYSYLSSMKRLLRVVNKEKFESRHLVKIKEDVSGTEESAELAIKKLGMIIQAFDSRLNILVGFGLNAFFLWDYHCLHRIDKWKKHYQGQFPLWIKTLGVIDAYSSLANYACNNSSFVFPVLSCDGKIISSKEMGHPLIPDNSRVSNDFSIERKGEICIVTGANMAGKSTFLRTVAVNFIMAMTGSPVCATEMEFTPVKLFTSMRTTDSLSGNESYFYAELKRLRILKDEITASEPVLFILDEILKGTNSTDKTLGSRMFLKQLLLHSGTGLIATHDLSLSDLEKEHPDNVFNMCFEIEINGESVLFDYKLRKGVTQKMNAALLMKQMGILE